MTLYKWLAEDGACYNGGIGKWPLPRNGEPGAWMPQLELPLIKCEHAYHLCRPRDLVYHLGPALWVVETRGYIEEWNSAVGAQQARLIYRVTAWNERTAKLFACQCAEHVLPIFEAQWPNDGRPRRAIEVARRFIEGRATQEELNATQLAAWDAAEAAGTVRFATKNVAAYSAWAAWGAARAVQGNAGTTADKALWVTWDAAEAACSWHGEREWQATRLCELLGIERDTQ